MDCYLCNFLLIAVKGRECNAHDDCNAIDKASCVKDTDDYKMRCLCGDDSTPSNGLCPDVLKGKNKNQSDTLPINIKPEREQ